MPLLPEREHMQLWCPASRTVVVTAPEEGKRLLVAGSSDIAAGTFGPTVDASPPLNRLDMAIPGQPPLKIPQTCLCFGANCAAWQWSNWHRGPTGIHFPSLEKARERDPNQKLEQLGYCGLAAPFDIVPPSRMKVAASNDGGDQREQQH
jgi:hypothetical protein